jgi:hypothetical protein
MDFIGEMLDAFSDKLDTPVENLDATLRIQFRITLNGALMSLCAHSKKDESDESLSN